jgi:hypothetical protein
MTGILFDRRRRKRIDVALPVILENATGVTRDASASGVFFWKRGTFMYGDSIRFAIERISKSGKILQKCRGVVVRTEPDDKGVGVAARITESTTEHVPGHPPGPDLLESAPEPPRAIAQPEDSTPPSASEAVLPELAAEEPPAIAEAARDTPASAGKTAMLDSARERLPTIAWPTDEAFFSPDKTVSLDTAREQPRADAQPFDGAPESAHDADSLDFVQGQPGTIAQHRVDALASAIPTINRWSSLLRGMALDACEESRGQEALEWNIPPAADVSTVHSHRMTVCSVSIVGLRPEVSRVPRSRRILGVSYRDLARLRASVGFDTRRTAGGTGAGEDSRFITQPIPPDAHGLRIELAIRAANGPPGERVAGMAPLPRIVVRTTSVPDDRQRSGDAYCYEEMWYTDPREAFEAFMRLAGESAILVNLALLSP